MTTDNNTKDKKGSVDASSSSWSMSSLFITKNTYKQIAAEFHPFHRHDLNVFLHVLTSGLGVWGAIQLAAVVLDLKAVVYAYAALIGLTAPLATAIVHSAFVYACLQVTPPVQATMLLIGVEESSYTRCPRRRRQ